MQSDIVTDESSKRQKFVTIANARVNQALKTISLIGNLSNKAAYDYSKEDITRMFKALTDAVEIARQRFEPKGPGKTGFRLE